MNNDSIQELTDAIRDVPDFPKPGIVFKDITPILANGDLFRLSVDLLVAAADGKRIDKIVGIDARGFLFGAAVADRLGIGFVPVRKKGKLPYKTISESYALEYGEATVEMHVDAIAPGKRVMLVDDLLATGGTAAAAISLIQRLEGVVATAQFLVELKFLKGRERLCGLGEIPVNALIQFS